MPHMPQKGEDHRSNHMTTKSRREEKDEKREREDEERGL